jgi:hypothetical protein
MFKNKKVAYGITLLTLVIAAILAYWFVSPYYESWRFEREIRNQSPFIKLIATQAPDEFNAYVTKIKNNIITKGSPDNDVYYTAELINALLLKYGPRASNESLYHYLQSDIELDKKLFAIDPNLVLFHEFPALFKGKIDFNKYNAIHFKENMLQAVEEVITSGIQHPQPLPTLQDKVKAEKMFQGMIAELAKKYGADKVTATFQHPQDPSVDKKMAAEIMMALSEEILAQGQDTVGLLLRVSLLVNTTSAPPAKK